jgi:hypothetical protein
MLLKRYKSIFLKEEMLNGNIRDVIGLIDSAIVYEKWIFKRIYLNFYVL